MAKHIVLPPDPKQWSAHYHSLWKAFYAGFELGWEAKEDDNYPVRWLLRREFESYLNRRG